MDASTASVGDGKPPKVILVIGGCGYVAQFLLQSLLERAGEFTIHATHRPGRSLEQMPREVVQWHELQPSKAPEVEAVMAKVSPDVVVNCSAMSNLKQCEADPAAADEANCPQALLEALQRAGMKRSLLFIHFSTDIVFDGNPERVYTEESVAEPVNAYGRSKLKFDALVVACEVPTCVVLRPPNILGPRHPYCNTGGKFLQWLDSQLKEEKQSNLFMDEYRNYIWVEELVAVVVKLLDNFPTAPPPHKLIHCGGPDALNRLEVAESLAQAKGYALDFVDKDGCTLPKAVPTKRGDVNLGYPSPLCIRFSSPLVESVLGRPIRAIPTCIQTSLSKI